MVKTHARRSKRRFQRVNNLSDEERIAEANRITKELDPSTKFETTEEGDGWSIAKAVKQEEELEAIKSGQTLTICEDCMRLMELLGKPGWKGGVECDICGEREWCNIFEPDETLELGDVYQNSVSEDWGEEPPIISPQETEKDMIICNFCGTNWSTAWGTQCQRCGQGQKMVQSIPSKPTLSGETERVCDTCGELWAEKEGCTTCSFCEYGVIKYIKKLPPDVAPKHLDPKLPDLRRIFTVDWDGTPGADGGARMVEKRTHDPELDDYDGHLYSTKQDY